ncbi:Anaphase-promoting complex subunit 1 [Pseudozyma hubeiensis]|nr:Anaphase-promoting complex subunit 1 [Pseudozyma hubeiensis]
MSASQRISARVAHPNTPANVSNCDASSIGEPSELLARLRKIRARSTATTQGCSVSPAPRSEAFPAASSSSPPSPASSSAASQCGSESHINAQDELRWHDHRLTWTRGSILMRSFSFPTPVLQSFWTLFQLSSQDTVEVATGKIRQDPHNQPPTRAICVFFEQAVHIHFPGTGEQVDMDLPFRFSRAFPAPLGFLIQRQIESEDERIASKLQRPSMASSLPPPSSNVGYPFPDLSSSSDSVYDLSNILDEYEQASASQIHHDPARLLPMVFYLSRCYDDLVPVDRFPQLSFSTSPSTDPKPLTHGPASPFGEMDETVAFVSTHSHPHHPPFVVTTSMRDSVIRVYAFAARPDPFDATPALLSTPRVHPGLGMTAAGHQGMTNGFHDQAPTSQSQHTDQPPTRSHVRTLSDTSGAPLSTALGRGFPSTLRRSARIDLERRTSGMPTTNMGRDPSGRSRRISAMHTATSDRRSTGRKDDQVTQARDRTLANISHTADGLRLQSQPYQHDTIMDELGAAGTSMRIPTNPTSAARLRRSSQAAARTPYAGPRNSNRVSNSAIKPRLSLNFSRVDTSADPSRLTSALPTATIDGLGPDALDGEAGIADDDQMDLARIADLDGFARSFACVCLLEEIKLPGLTSAANLDGLRVSTASFDRVDPDAAYVFLSVPLLGQTFCRRLGYQRLGSRDNYRNLPFCKAPSKAQATAAVPCADLLALQTMAPDSTEVLTKSSDGTFQIHFGPPGSNVATLDISGFGPLKEAPARLSAPATSLKLAAAEARSGRCVQLTSEGSEDRIDVLFDFRPSCPIATRVLRVLLQTLPHRLAAKVKSRWVQARFLTGPGLPSKYGQAAIAADWTGLKQVFAASARNKAQIVHSDTAHRLFQGDPLLRGLTRLEDSVNRAKTNADVPTLTEDALPTEDAHHILTSLYMLAEEMRLDTSHTEHGFGRVPQLAIALAQGCHAPNWVEALRTRFASDGSRYGHGLESGSHNDTHGKIPGPPQDLYEAILNTCSGSGDRVGSIDSWVRTAAPVQLAQIAPTFPMLDAVFRTFSVLGQAHPDPQARSTAVIDCMIMHGLDLERLRRLPFGIASPLYQAIRCCQDDPPSGKTAEFYQVIQRAEIALNSSTLRGTLSTANARRIPEQLIRTLPEDAPLDAICAQLFSRDFRLRDVVAMLKTDAVNSVYVAEGENQTEAAIAEQHNAAVAAISERTKALSPGRAMLFMTSRQFSSTHKWRIPSICLAVKVRPRGTTIEPVSKADAAGLDWPEFHNGVASVLELNLNGNVSVDSKWIFAHLGEQVTARHAGFLYGLGLMKQLPTLTPVHVFRYLKMRNNLLTIGFLLGMAVSTVATADPTARHLIGMQLTAFLPPGSAPLNLSTITQTAGLLAMGLVFLGSNHRWTAKRMLDQIGAQESPTPNIQPQHREAYSLSAGLALGLVYLGKGRGDGMKSLPDKRIIARLVHLIKGDGNGESKAGFSMLGGLRSDGGSGTGYEINLTSAPAALAFGLIYLRSNCKMVADVMAPPQTPRELDTLRPDVLFVHVLARSIIMWDSIQPTKRWLHSVLPGWLQKRIESGKSMSEAAQLAQTNIEAGACFAIGLKYAGSKDLQARDCLWQQLHKLDKQVKVQTVSFSSKIRKAALQAALDQARISLALVLAGSGDVDLLRQLRRAHGDVDGDVCYGSHMATHMALGLLFLGGGRFTLGTSDLGVAALLISFLPPFPRWSGDNRAHLQAFRHLWFLAIEPRLLIATDVETNQLVSLPVRMAASATTDSHPCDAEAFTPLLLPNRQLSGSIRTATDRYWSASIDSSGMTSRTTAAASVARTASSTTSQALFVKRRTAHLDYLADPHGSRSLTSHEIAPLDLLLDSIRSIGPRSDDLREAMRGFAAAGKERELVRSVSLHSTSDDATLPPMRSATMECLVMDKMYMLPTYVSLLQLQRRIEAGDETGWARSYREVRFADEFYRRHHKILFGDDAEALVQPNLLTNLRRNAQQLGKMIFERNAGVRETITHILTSMTGPLSGASEDVYAVLVASDLDDAEEGRGLIRMIRHQIQQWQKSGQVDTQSIRGEVDVDLVRINKAYFHTEQRLKAVIVYRQNKCVLIRMLDEFENSKAHRLQLEFNREEDVESFLSLIEPDSTFHDACRRGLPKEENRNFSDASKSAADERVNPTLEEKSYDTKTIAFDDAQPGSQSQGLGEKLLQLNQIRGRRPVETVSAQLQSLPSPGSQSQNVGCLSASCPNCAHTIRPHSSETAASSSGAKFALNSTSEHVLDLSLRQTQTPTTDMTDASVYEQVDEDDEDLDDGLYGWPDPSAIECIQDDVRRLCLTDPNLDHMIAHCVEEYFRELLQL